MFFHDASLERIIQAIRLTGADSTEFWLETPDFWLNDLDEDRLRAILKEYPAKTPLSIHAPVLDLNPCSINPDIRAASIEWISRSILLSKRLGARVCTIHPGKRTAKRPPGKVDYERINEMLDIIGPVAEESGVKVAIENMEPAVNALLTTPDEVMNLLDARPWLWFTLDIAHAAILGTDAIKAFIEKTGGRIANIHLSSGGKGGMHMMVSSDPQTRKFVEIIDQSAYDQLITLEINDLTLPSVLNYQEKVTLLRDEIKLVRTWLQ
jgi:sugar phosphate isomerase/epimerase